MKRCIAFATVAIAQTGDTATLTTKLTPKNAGTKSKPKNSTLDLNVVNGNVDRTMSDLDIFMPKTLKISLKGMPSCSSTTIQARACPTSSILGRGEAKAKTGVNGTSPGDLTFDVKAVKTKSQVHAQHAGTAFNGLVSLQTKLGKKKGSNKLLATTGCKNKKQPFKVVLTFIDNGKTTATKYGDTSSSKCTK